MSGNLAAAREALGASLRQLRREAGLSGRDLARRTGWLPSKVSKIENGKQTPSIADLDTWTRACGAPGETAAALRTQLAALESFYAGWRRQTRAGVRFPQRRWLTIESSVRRLEVFEPHFIPGLLQTADYARLRLQAAARIFAAPDDVDDAVALRMQRQELLHRPTKRFEFVIAEISLRSGAYAPRDVMAAQVDRLLVTTTHTTVRLGIIPFGVLWPANIDHGFWIFDSNFVLVETAAAELKLTQDDEIGLYRRIFAELAGIAVYGPEARHLLTAALNDLRAD